MTTKLDESLDRENAVAVARVRTVAKWSSQGRDTLEDIPPDFEDDFPEPSERPTDPCPVSAVECLPTSRVREIMPPEAVPWLMLSFAEIKALPLDPTGGFLLSLIDGRTSVEALLDLSGMPHDKALSLLARWRIEGVIDVR